MLCLTKNVFACVFRCFRIVRTEAGLLVACPTPYERQWRRLNALAKTPWVTRAPTNRTPNSDKNGATSVRRLVAITGTKAKQVALLAVAAVEAAAAKAATAAVPMARVAATAAEAVALQTPACTHGATTTETRRFGNPDETKQTIVFRRTEDLLSKIVDRPQQGRAFTRERAVHTARDDATVDAKARRERGSVSPSTNIAP